MRLLLSLLLPLVVAVADRRRLELHTGDEDYAFHDFVKEWRKAYATMEEYHRRRQVYTNNLEMIKRHNDNPLNTWKMVRSSTSSQW